MRQRKPCRIAVSDARNACTAFPKKTSRAPAPEWPRCLVPVAGWVSTFTRRPPDSCRQQPETQRRFADRAAVRQTPAVAGGRSSSPQDDCDDRAGQRKRRTSRTVRGWPPSCPSVSLIILGLPPDTGAALDTFVRCCVTGRNQSPPRDNHAHHLSRWCAHYNRCCRPRRPERQAHHGTG